MGCDDNDVCIRYGIWIFLLTHPVWDVTAIAPEIDLEQTFLLTHPVWDVTLRTVYSFTKYNISTHTSRVGCDGMPERLAQILKFLLTHPVWDVTNKKHCTGKRF